MNSQNVLFTGHVVLHTFADLLGEISFAFEQTIFLRVSPIVSQGSFRGEKTSSFVFRYPQNRHASSCYLWFYYYPRFSTWAQGECKISDFWCFHWVVKKHLQK